MGVPTALLDANVLYPAGLQDFLLRLVDEYLYTPSWNTDIHGEWIRSVVARELSAFGFVRRAENVVPLGTLGVRKTHFSIGLVIKTAEMGQLGNRFAGSPR